jgi:low temperature requirement protein LtrA
MAAEPRRSGIGAAVAAANQRARDSLLRNHGGGHAPVSNLELFFDLVFVFAITQLSHFLHYHISLIGLFEGGLLFLTLWWAWIFTTWAANWLNPDRLPVRLVLFGVMLLSLGMAVSLPAAFGESALSFAANYVALQLGRSLIVAAMFKFEGAHNALNMLRIAIWFAAAALFWIGGALVGGSTQLVCWSVALAIEYSGPFALFRVPGLGRSKLSDWDISGSHMAERCALFIIIALGEGIVVIGAGVASQPWDPAMLGAPLVAFLISGLMWWLYFDIGMARVAQRITGHAQVGRLARNVYTYLHMPIVLGIVIAAVGDALLVEQWNQLAGAALVYAYASGLALFLVGLGLFKRSANTFGNFPFSHTITLAFLVLLTLWGALARPSSLLFATSLAALLLLTAVWEWVSYHGGWVERMEARGMWLGHYLRRRTDRARERRLAREAQEGVKS